MNQKERKQQYNLRKANLGQGTSWPVEANKLGLSVLGAKCRLHSLDRKEYFKKLKDEDN